MTRLAARGGGRRTRTRSRPRRSCSTPPTTCTRLRSSREGLVMPQSRASMLVARALDPRPGERVLDLCAAPGAKTTHLAALMQDEGEVVAVEADAARAEAIAENAPRLGASSVRGARRAMLGALLRRRLRPRARRSALLAISARFSPAPTHGGESPPRRWTSCACCSGGSWPRPRRRCGPAAASCTPRARSAPPRTRSRCRISSAANANFRVCNLTNWQPKLAAPTAGTAPAGFLQTLPHRDGTDGFFIAALERTE